MPNQNQPVFPNHRRRSSNRYWRHPNYQVLAPFPRTYFEAEFPGVAVDIFESTTGGLTIPKELNRKILQYLPGKDLLKFSMVSKKAEMIVKHGHVLMYDAIHEQIGDLVGEFRSSWD